MQGREKEIDTYQSEDLSPQYQQIERKKRKRKKKTKGERSC